MSIEPGSLNELMQNQWKVEQFLYEEAALLSERRFDEWLTVIAQDIEYAMPAREVRAFRDRDDQFLPLNKGAHFHDNHATLAVRVKKLADPKTWAENPHVYHRMAISNVRVRSGDVPGEFWAFSNFIFTRTRLDQVYVPLVGWRRDKLRVDDNPLGFLLAGRTIYLDHINLPGSGVSSFL